MIPESWESIDLIKQTEGLMCTTASLSLTEELLFVHKAQAIVDFCIECRNLWKAFKLDFTPSEGNYGYLKLLVWHIIVCFVASYKAIRLVDMIPYLLHLASVGTVQKVDFFLYLIIIMLLTVQVNCIHMFKHD